MNRTDEQQLQRPQDLIVVVHCALFTLQVIADKFSVTRQAISDRRDKAIAHLTYAAMQPGASALCADLVRQACSLAADHEDDLVPLLDAFERAGRDRRARDWVILVLRLAGKQPTRARRIADAACARQRTQILATRLQQRQTRTRQRQSARLDAFLAKAIWPTTTRHDWHLDQFSAQRDVQTHLENTGSFYSDKLGRQVQYESVPELKFLTKLEHHAAVTGYQEQPLSIPYTLAGNPHIYIPDVIVIFDDGRALLVEIKAPLYMALVPNLRKWATTARWCAQHGAGLLIGDGDISATDMLLGPEDPGFRDRLVHAVNDHSLRFHEYSTGVGQGRTPNELAAIVGTGHVSWRLPPFSLSQPTHQEARDARAFTKLLRNHKHPQ